MKKTVLRPVLITLEVVVFIIVALFVYFFFTADVTRGQMTITKDGKTQTIVLDICYPEENGLTIGKSDGSGGITIDPADPFDPQNITPWVNGGGDPVIQNGKSCTVSKMTIKRTLTSHNVPLSFSYSGELDAVCSSPTVSVNIHAQINNCQAGFQIM